MKQAIEMGMFVRETGPAEASRTLLYVHGLGESGLCFERLALLPQLASFRQFIPDLPGYGRSAWPAEPLCLPEQADLLANWLSSRGLGPVVLVGHSMGGVMGTIFCERHPEAVRAFVNVEGNLSPQDCVFSGQAVRMDEKRFIDGGFSRMRELIYTQGVDLPALRGYYASLRLCDPRLFHRNSCELVEISATEGMARRLAALPVPTWYVAGTPDGVCPRSHDLLKQAGIDPMIFDPSGHWPFIDHQDRFAEGLAGILSH
jgi:pimeloyl-ACP methyl ester carboxylesterase